MWTEEGRFSLWRDLWDLDWKEWRALDGSKGLLSSDRVIIQDLQAFFEVEEFGENVNVRWCIYLF